MLSMMTLARACEVPLRTTVFAQRTGSVTVPVEAGGLAEES